MAGGKLVLVSKGKQSTRGLPKASYYPIRKQTRRRNKYNQRSLIFRNICPNSLIVPLVLVPSKVDIVCTSGASGYDVWRCNNIYAPVDGTTATPQPLGHDEWAAFYKYYRVIAGKFEVSAYNATDTNPFEIALNASGATGGAGSLGLAAEGRAKMRTGGHNKSVVRSSLYRKMHNIFGVSKANYMADPNYKADTNTSPGKEGIWQVWVRPFDESSTVTISVKMRITYYVLFSNPKFLVAS